MDHRGDAMVETGRITFAELDRRARSLALRLGEEGVTDQAVLLLYPAGLPFLSAFFGCLYARSVAVPSRCRPPIHGRSNGRRRSSRTPAPG